MQIWFNMQKSGNVIYHIIILKNKIHMVNSIDAETYFDKIHYVFKTKKNFNKGGIHLNIILSYTTNSQPTSY